MTWDVLPAVRKTSLGFSLLAAISIILLSASPAKAGTAMTITQSTCPIVIDQPGTYFLATDVGPCAPDADGIDISASNVTLHLNGHTITGSATPGTCNANFGISVFSSGPALLTNVNVLGSGTISDFLAGFFASNSANSSVKFVKVTSNNCPFFTFGLAIEPPGGQWMLQGNVVRGAGQNGSEGILVFGVNNNTFVQNDVNNTIGLFDTSNNIIVNNTASDNEGGIFLGTITLGSNNNQIHANTTNNNTEGGSGLSITVGSVGNNVSGNFSSNNLPFDMEDDNPNCGSNRWQGNHFNTASQPCIH